MDDEVPALEARIVRFVVPERDVSDRHIIETIGQFRLLERLMPEVSVRIKMFRQPEASQETVGSQGYTATTRTLLSILTHSLPLY